MRIKSIVVVCIFCVAVISTLSCKKAAEEQYNDIIKKLMTDGSWVVTNFTEGGTNITASFNGWVCKFYDNNTMTATQGSGSTAVVKSGTWQSNVNAYTITAQFSSTVADPLAKINGTWSIAASTATVGTFNQTKAGIAYTMELTKY